MCKFQSTRKFRLNGGRKIRLEKNHLLTVDGEHVGLDDVLVPLSVASVVARMLQLDPGQVEAAIAEDPHLVLVYGREVQLVPAPNDWGDGAARYVALDLNVVSNAGG